MRLPINIILLCCVMAGFFGSCNDILETEITDQKLTVLAPQDSSVLAGNEVVFNWDPIKGAANYHLQIARPSFAEAIRIVTDTLMASTRFSVTLTPGWYEWRLKGLNSAYETEFKYSTFRLDSSGNIEDYKVVLKEPADGFRTRSSKVTFRWEPLELADFYIFDLKGADTSIFMRMEETFLEAEFNMDDGNFSWQVLAREDEADRTSSSEVRTFAIDNTPPAIPATISPKENDSFATNVDISFSWEAVTDTDLEEYILLIYKAEDDVNPFFEKAFTTTSVELFGPDYPTKLPVGDYLWEIQTVDKLGNLSPLESKLMPFTISAF